MGGKNGQKFSRREARWRRAAGLGVEPLAPRVPPRLRPADRAAQHRAHDDEGELVLLEDGVQHALELRGGELAQVVLERRLERERLVDVAVQPRQLLRRGARGSGGGEALGVVEEA